MYIYSLILIYNEMILKNVLIHHYKSKELKMKLKNKHIPIIVINNLPE